MATYLKLPRNVTIDDKFHKKNKINDVKICILWTHFKDSQSEGASESKIREVFVDG